MFVDTHQKIISESFIENCSLVYQMFGKQIQVGNMYNNI